MFAYCNNSPVTCFDPSGSFLRNNIVYIDDRGIGDPDNSLGNSNNPYDNKGEYFYGNRFQIGSKNEEETVLKDLAATSSAFYKGVLYVKCDIMDNAAFSMGIVFIGPNAKGVDIIRHEYGHVLHMKEIGFWNYLTYVVFPSTLYFHINGVDNHYYSLPWEYAAEIRGQVNREDGDFKYQDYAEVFYDFYFSSIG